jgi:hypothetical protein
VHLEQRENRSGQGAGSGQDRSGGRVEPAAGEQPLAAGQRGERERQAATKLSMEPRPPGWVVLPVMVLSETIRVAPSNSAAPPFPFAVFPPASLLARLLR